MPWSVHPYCTTIWRIYTSRSQPARGMEFLLIAVGEFIRTQRRLSWYPIQTPIVAMSRCAPSSGGAIAIGSSHHEHPGAGEHVAVASRRRMDRGDDPAGMGRVSDGGQV